MIRLQFYIKGALWFAILAIALTGCGRTGPTAPSEPSAASPSPAETSETQATATLVEPSATPLPAAARVNGIEISLPEYQAGLAQFQAAAGGAEPTPQDKQRVIDSLVDEALLAEAAVAEGYQASDDEITERTAALAEALGGQAALDAWMQANGYDAAGFRRALQRAIAAAWMRDQIITAVPRSAEQIHARQILLYNAGEAQDVYSQLQAGSSFDNLAIKYDPVTRGDLGWFPRGYLTDAKLDEAVFPLEPGATTAVIETAAGFHIIQVLERSADRALSPEALLAAQTRALREWLEQRRSQSQIEILLP